MCTEILGQLEPMMSELSDLNVEIRVCADESMKMFLHQVAVQIYILKFINLN